MTATLNLAPNLDAPDAFYEALIEAHRDLTPEQSHRLNARLILLLANQVGDLAVLREALAQARAGLAAA
ncbi:DUF2783 domain-containing protein [Roseomonas hellenica]|uniref:DUF2783 domain-containing protein n=1 Tax=Plastoroseomonas hellenica TaxID=2687306 RepID=A0ABS5EXC0_9PROT|nr:DUF2783 domain-containing protein [Plastoroseomonas hellenica]MBR0664947.1 DUF2783 domain-containing protein [Plastoroseomonas hellenica]